ncbi:cytosine/adenosine deaminase-related metal-dependent hydrolase [Pseudochelatococcus lubricantis]|uniref:Cytosine/adenosine deaminase-related metal-dependent hydrolase n=1 Tax=Pseudochelatococcus lubricantis TaxID=1538102 RepID=A0ABX0V1M4_9HYPH|nr:amidohydrolase family protein [Pseudochelatococcus lubricantis]NIJ59096.1 cytosine/adenosine deaminase-related metal-dependent hydrolase [Pseudochelatococcus lubricantis]
MRTLIRNLNFLFTVDESDTVLRNASIVIDADRIADIGPAAAIADRHAPESFDQVIDGSMLGMCPGFVDSHVHLSETLSRAAFPDNLNTRAWVFHWAKPFYAHITAEDEYWGALLGITEMLRGGTTCFLDMGSQYDPGIVVRAMEPTGIRGITGRHAADNRPAELPRGWTEEMADHHFFPDAQTALRELEACVVKYNGALDGRARCWVNIEGKEPCTLELHVGAVALAEKLGVGTTYHLTTSIEEARVCESKYGCWPITRIDRVGGIRRNLVIAHCAAVTDEEVQLLAERGAGVAFCPCSSFKLGKGATAIGKYPEMAQAGVKVGLGTDGVSAAGNLNLMRQMLLVAGMFKDARIKPDVFTARQALRAATIEGAKALLWDDEIGSLEIGKKADFVLFDLDHVEWTPFHDPLQALVFSASTASVSQTWVNGVKVYGEGKVHGVDERHVRRKARELAAAAVVRAGLHKDDVETATTLYDEGN